MIRYFMLLAITVIALSAGLATAQAGPCTEQIAQTEQRIRQAQAVASPGEAGTPSAPQSVGAQLHHQPTPGSVEGAEHKAREMAAAALDRARAADAAGDQARCARALEDAKELYGLQ